MYYENLSIYGKEIIRMIENELRTFDEESRQNLAYVFDPSSDQGYQKIISNGVVNVFFYEWGYASYQNQPFTTISGRNEIIYQVPEIPWATTYIRNPSNVLEDRMTRDFSRFNTLRLELKAATDGQVVEVAIKDDTDPDDGSETRESLTLSSEWKYYDIPLSKFDTADLTRLFVVAAFVFQGEPKQISVRSIEYLK